MRINNLVFVIALFAWIISALPANAQSVAIPDTNFLKFLKLNYPRTIDASDKLLILEAGKVRGSFLCDNKSVKNVEGLQYFTNISNLNLSNNDLQQLPTFLNLGVLESINISNNKLTALPNLTRNRRLKEIIASNNLIASGINFSGNDSLRKLIINTKNKYAQGSCQNRFSIGNRPK